MSRLFKRKKTPIATIGYDEVDYIWISNFLEIPAEGTCMYENKFCEFLQKTTQRKNNKKFETLKVEIYPVSFFRKLKLKFNQRLFEICVGYHFSYGHEDFVKSFYFRKPKWLYRILFEFYYICKNANIIP